MMRGLKRVIIGIVLTAIGVFGWYRTLLESIPPPNSPPPWYGVDMFSSFPVIIVHSIIAAIGVVLLVSGVKDSHSS